MPPDEPVESPAPRATASRVIATLLFWAVPSLLVLLTGIVTTYVLEFYDKAHSPQVAMAMWLMHFSCPSCLNAVAFAIVLNSRPRIARHGALRLYVTSAVIGVAALVLSLVVFVLITNSTRGDHVTLFLLVIPPIVAAVVSIVAIECLIRVGWLPRWTPGICEACGYTLTPGSAGPCPECGSVRPSV